MRLIQLTDCHLQADANQLFKGCDPEARLTQVLAHIQTSTDPYDLLLLTGDLVHHGYPSGYQRLAGYLGDMAAQACWLPGNHDDVAEMQRYKQLLTKEHHIGAWYILLLDSTSQPDGVGTGSISDSEFRWLKKRLDKLGHQTNILIALHHPPVDVGSAWQDAIKLGNAKAFIDLVASYPAVKLVLCGHLHQEHHLACAQAQLLVTPATAPQFKMAMDEPMIENDDRLSLPSYRVIDLYPTGEFETCVHRVSI